MEILIQRQKAYVARSYPGGVTTCPPLYEWFIRAGDENFVQLPKSEPAPKRERTPRVYRSAASLRAERDEIQAKIDNFGDNSIPDRAAANLSPNARSRAARTAGRRRFERMDRDLERFTALTRRVEALNHRIALQDARERKLMNPGA